MSNSKSRVYLNKLTLYNYRTYLADPDPITIEFSPDAKKPITIIHGESGEGKTTIMNAIHWCLYGTEKNLKESDETILCKYVVEELKLNESNQTYVTADMYDEDGLLYRMTRDVNFTRTTMTDKTQKADELFGTINAGIIWTSSITVQYRDNKGQMQTLDDTEGKEYIKNVFPEILSNYILFDAELLNKFLYQKADDLIKEGIEKISDLPILEESVEHFKRTASSLEKGMGVNDAKLKNLLSNKQTYEDATDDYKGKIERTEKILKEKDRELEDINSWMNAHSEKTVADKQKQIDKIEEDKKGISDSIDELEKQLAEMLHDSLFKLYLHEPIKEVEAKFNQYETENKIPPVVGKVALEKIIQKKPHICTICGTEIAENTEAFDKIKSMKDNMIDSVMIRQITSGRYKLSSMLADTDKQKKLEEYEKLKGRLATARKKLSKSKTEVNALSDEIRNVDQEDIREKATNRDSLKREIGESQASLGGFKKDDERAKNALAELQPQIDEAKEKDQAFNEINAKTNLINAGRLMLEEMRVSLLSTFKKVVEDKTSKYFKQIAPRSEDFSGVKIAENFQIRALDNHGKVVLTSMGQSHCLGLSYIAAIRDIMKKYYFIMIDSPLHNISQEAKRDVAEALPSWVGETQVTLMVTDQEYTGVAQEKISGKTIGSAREALLQAGCVWREYILEVVREGNKVKTIIRQFEDKK